MQNDEPLDSWWNSAPQSPWPPTSIHGHMEGSTQYPKKTLGAQRTKQPPPRLHKHGELPGARQAPSRAPEPRRHNQQRTPGVPKTSWEPGLPRHSDGVSRTTTRETSGPQRSETARSSDQPQAPEGKPAADKAMTNPKVQHPPTSVGS